MQITAIKSYILQQINSFIKHTVTAMYVCVCLCLHLFLFLGFL